MVVNDEVEEAIKEPCIEISITVKEVFRRLRNIYFVQCLLWIIIGFYGKMNAELLGKMIG